METKQHNQSQTPTSNAQNSQQVEPVGSRWLTFANGVVALLSAFGGAVAIWVGAYNGLIGPKPIPGPAQEYELNIRGAVEVGHGPKTATADCEGIAIATLIAGNCGVVNTVGLPLGEGRGDIDSQGRKFVCNFGGDGKSSADSSPSPTYQATAKCELRWNEFTK